MFSLRNNKPLLVVDISYHMYHNSVATCYNILHSAISFGQEKLFIFKRKLYIYLFFSWKSLPKSEYEERSVTAECQNSGEVLAMRSSTSSYQELSSLQVNRNRGNHYYNNINPSISLSSSTGANEQSSSPPLLVVDEDYDT